MPYSINQLSDLLLPELQDIATHLAIPETDGLDKQRLIYKIIDQQAVAESRRNGAQHSVSNTSGDNPSAEGSKA